jgi:uncharacterized protein
MQVFSLVRAALASVLLLALPNIAMAGFKEGLAAYDRGDYATAYPELLLVATQADPKAQFFLASMHYKGEGVLQDRREAMKWYRRAAEQGDAQVQHLVGRMYAWGDGVPQDYSEAVKWYRRAAEQGEPDAQFSLGLSYDTGQGVPQNHSEAAKWYRRAAEQGHAKAQKWLGSIYALGQGVPQDFLLAHMWYNLSASQQSGQEAQDTRRERDIVANRLTPGQLATAQQLAREWRPKPGSNRRLRQLR